MSLFPSEDLHRGLKARHIELIALGGIIGSCYFLGTGQVVAQVGPAAFLAYILGGVIVYLTMLCMGELAVAIPISGSFITYAADYISPTVACGTGWSYWLNWVITHSPQSGVLSEQLHPYTGEQLSANPLTWSHAEYVRTVILYHKKLESFGVCSTQ